MSANDLGYVCRMCGEGVPPGAWHMCGGIMPCDLPKPPDELNVPLTRRDALFLVQVIVEIQQANPLLAQSDLWPLVWERLTVAWRSPNAR